MKNKNESRWTKPLMTLALLLACCAIRTTSAQTVPEIAEKALAATVYLQMKDSNGLPLGFGSGFFVKSNLIATNYHVIAGAASGTAKVVGKDTTYKVEGCTAIDRDNDLALLKVLAYGIKPLPLGNSDTVRIGETVYVAGNPMGLEGTFSDGIISSQSGLMGFINRNLHGIISRFRTGNTNDRFQMTAPVSPGSSGGPVLNNRGEVIGVSVAAPRGVDAQNLNFAIPSNSLKRLLDQTEPDKPSWDSHPVSAETYFLHGKALHELKFYDAAIEVYTQAIHLKPDYANAYYNRGAAKAKLGEHFAAISDFDEVIRLEPNSADAYCWRGNAKRRLGRPFAAIRDYDEAIHLKPDYVLAYLNRGVVKGRLARPSAAISDYSEAIRLKPDYADAYYWRGLAKKRLGLPSAAIRDYNEAIRLKPDYALAYLNRGHARVNLGQHFAAISDYSEAIRLKPDYADAYYWRGLAKARLFYSMWEAKQDLRTAVRLAEKAGDTDTKARAEEELRRIQ